MSFAEFFHMGGYAPYVWSSWGLTLLVLAINFFGPLQRERELLRRLGNRARRRAS